VGLPARSTSSETTNVTPASSGGSELVARGGTVLAAVAAASEGPHTRIASMSGSMGSGGETGGSALIAETSFPAGTTSAAAAAAQLEGAFAATAVRRLRTRRTSHTPNRAEAVRMIGNREDLLRELRVT
ncbi:hypothetical protein Vretifemale_571, partial [Volvox reticuliferus]